MIRGERAAGGAVARGLCPSCRTHQRLLTASGKVMKHGRSVKLPDGCPGSYEPPLRVDGSGNPITGGTVVGYRAGEPGPSARGGGGA